jgi:hypothetical protein
MASHTVYIIGLMMGRLVLLWLNRTVSPLRVFIASSKFNPVQDWGTSRDVPLRLPRYCVSTSLSFSFRALTSCLTRSFEATVWAVPSFVENAIAVSCIGLFLGPMYPILVYHSNTILPKWLYSGAIGWISAFGQAGSAALPFLTGLLASKFGITALQPLYVSHAYFSSCYIALMMTTYSIVSMMSAMVVLWALVPSVRRIE